MVSPKVVSDNILKLRELTNKFCDIHDFDYYDMVNEIKSIITACKKNTDIEKNKDKKLRYYDLIISKIDAVVNQI